MTLTPLFTFSLLTTSLLIASASFKAEASNNDNGLYAGLSVSSVSYDSKDMGEEQSADNGVFSYSSSIDDNDTGFKAFAGYQFFENFAVEVAYMDAGGLSLNERESYVEGSDSLSMTANIAVNLSGVSASAIGRWALANDLHVFARAGFLSWDIVTEINVSQEVNMPSYDFYRTQQASKSIKVDGTDFIYSAGLSYDLDIVTLYAAYEVLDLTIEASEADKFVDEEDLDGEDLEDGSLDATSINVGIVYKF